jgi:hypothetical protein
VPVTPDRAVTVNVTVTVLKRDLDGGCSHCGSAAQVLPGP